MRYPYEDLDDSQFERLVVECMRVLFGIGVQAFAPGKDGGRDALFAGTAERFPSTAAPWRGTTVGQAKHTLSTNLHYSDPDFSGDSATSTLTQEITRIRSLVDDDAVDNYILFANRRLGGIAGPRIVARLAEESALPRDRIFLAGVEYLDDLLRDHPEVIVRANIDPVEGPLIVSSYDLAEVILAIAETFEDNIDVPGAEVADRVSYDDKNRLNNMSPEFADRLSKNYLRYTQTIEDFLADPANAESRERYEAAVEDFQLKIIEKRATFAAFDAVFNHLVDLLVGRDRVLASRRKLLRAVLFYMYWHCDIGEAPSAAAE